MRCKICNKMIKKNERFVIKEVGFFGFRPVHLECYRKLKYLNEKEVLDDSP